MKKISIASSCWNEAENILPFYERCKLELDRHPEYDYEFVISDNLSTDGTREILREIAAKDPKFKVILNANNFGHIRSPFNALLNASGDLVFYLCSDLQEPPEMLTEFLKKYEEGCKVIAENVYKAVKTNYPEAKTVVCLGDSITYGVYMTGKGSADIDADTYPGQLCKMLNKSC